MWLVIVFLLSSKTLWKKSWKHWFKLSINFWFEINLTSFLSEKNCSINYKKVVYFHNSCLVNVEFLSYIIIQVIIQISGMGEHGPDVRKIEEIGRGSGVPGEYGATRGEFAPSNWINKITSMLVLPDSLSSLKWMLVHICKLLLWRVVL